MSKGRFPILGVVLTLLVGVACGGQASPTPTAMATSTATTIAAPTPVARATPVQHVVQPGETMFAIAQRYGVSAAALAAANDIADPSRISAGRILTIPGPDFVVPTSTLGPSLTATSISATATPTTVRVTVTPTATLVLATATPTASLATPTAIPAFAFGIQSVTRIPNCGVTQIWGHVTDVSGNALPGHLVKVGVVGADWSAVSNPTAYDGHYDVTLSNGVKAGRWYVYIVDSGGTQISDRVEVVTDSDESQCHPEGSGNQTPRVEFRRRS